jgi:hypothetical protein
MQGSFSEPPICSRIHPVIDSELEGYRESRGCSRDTQPESYITKYTSIRRIGTHSEEDLSLDAGASACSWRISTCKLGSSSPSTLRTTKRVFEPPWSESRCCPTVVYPLGPGGRWLNRRLDSNHWSVRSPKLVE